MTLEKPYDLFMLIPIATRIVLNIVFSYININPFITNLLIELITLVSIVFVKYTRKISICTKNNKNNQYSLSKLNNTILDSIFELGVASCFTMITNIPPFSIISFVASFFVGNFIDIVLWSIGYSCIYIFHNLFLYVDLNSYCDSSTISTTKQIKTVVALLMLCVSNVAISLNPKKFLKKKLLKHVSRRIIDSAEGDDGDDDD